MCARGGGAHQPPLHLHDILLVNADEVLHLRRCFGGSLDFGGYPHAGCRHELELALTALHEGQEPVEVVER